MLGVPRVPSLTGDMNVYLFSPIYEPGSVLGPGDTKMNMIQRIVIQVPTGRCTG